MAAITFDRPAYSDSLQKAGVPREQAEAMAKANAEAFGEMADTCELAAKKDIAAVRQEIAAIRHDLEIALANTKHDILRWMVMGMIAQTALLVWLLALLR